MIDFDIYSELTSVRQRTPPWGNLRFHWTVFEYNKLIQYGD